MKICLVKCKEWLRLCIWGCRVKEERDFNKANLDIEVPINSESYMDVKLTEIFI